MYDGLTIFGLIIVLLKPRLMKFLRTVRNRRFGVWRIQCWAITFANEFLCPGTKLGAIGNDTDHKMNCSAVTAVRSIFRQKGEMIICIIFKIFKYCRGCIKYMTVRITKFDITSRAKMKDSQFLLDTKKKESHS